MTDFIEKYTQEKGLPKRKSKIKTLEENISHLRDLVDTFRRGLAGLSDQVGTVEKQFRIFLTKEQEKKRDQEKRAEEVDKILANKGAVIPHRESLLDLVMRSRPFSIGL